MINKLSATFKVDGQMKRKSMQSALFWYGISKPLKQACNTIKWIPKENAENSSE